MIAGLLKTVLGIGGGLVGRITGFKLGVTEVLAIITALVIGALVLGNARLRTQVADCRADRAVVTAAAFKAAKEASDTARAKEQALQDQVAALTATLEKDRHDANARITALSRGLNDGTLRVRREFCAQPPAHDGVPASRRTAGGTDAGPGLREHPAAAAIGTGARADLQVKGLQALVQHYRKTCNG